MDTSVDSYLDQIHQIEDRLNQHKNRGSTEITEVEEENRPGKQEVESATLPPTFRTEQGLCGFLTDVEGNYDYFERYVEISRVLQWTDAGRTQLELVGGAQFVFGGDSQDKGIGDIRFVKLLLDLKRRYPDRVHIIIGNRDVNKLRLATELSEEAMRDAEVMNDTSFPYWVDPGKRVTPQMYLERNGAEGEPLANSAANRLRWMLKETMGADGAFERRRTELKILTAGQDDISDEEVVRSFQREVDVRAGEDAFMLEYLRQGKLAHVFGKTLFTHSAVTENNMGAVPGRAERVEDVREWVRELNAWAKEELAAFERCSDAQALAGGGRMNGRARAGHGLMDYVVPGGAGGQSVIMSSYLKNGNPEKLARSVERYVARGGLSSLLAGHVPHGDCPVVIRGEQTVAVTADTSYSKMGHETWWGVDNRGEAVSEVVVTEDGSVQVHGFLADGSQIEYTVPPPGEEQGVEGDAYVGRQMDDRWWVKGKLKEGALPPGESEEGDEEAQYLLCLGVGFQIEAAVLGERGLRKQLGEDTGACAFMTDVLGDWDYLERYVAISKVLSWADDARTQLELAEDAEFVFGGNAQDRGIGDIRVVLSLLDLKSRYPDRVHLLVGDRDLQKLRLLSELDPRAIADPGAAQDKTFPYWLPPPLRVTPQMYLERNGAEGEPLANSAANRLRWMLKETMGADGAFERRRTELQILRGGEAAIADEEVVESFRTQMDPAAAEEEEEGAVHDAFMLEFLRQGKLAHVFAKTLMVHGGLTENNMGAVPGRAERVEDVREWVRELNAWMQREVAEYAQEGGQLVDKGRRAGRRLMDYGVPGGGEMRRSVVAESHLWSPTVAVPRPVEEYLAASRVSSVLTGHVPHGDCPAVIKRVGVVAVSCDTSLSEPGHASAWGADHRGGAVSEVLARRDGTLEVHGRLADGREIEYVLGDQAKGGAATDSRADPFVGRQLADTSWVKAKVKPSTAEEAQDPEYVLCFVTLHPQQGGAVPHLERKYVRHSFLAGVQPYRTLAPAMAPASAEAAAPQPLPTPAAMPPHTPPPQQRSLQASPQTPMQPPASPNHMVHSTPGGWSTSSQQPLVGAPRPAVQMDCAEVCCCCPAAPARDDVTNTRRDDPIVKI